MGVILMDFPLNPSANLRLSARRDFFRDSGQLSMFLYSLFFFREKANRARVTTRIIIMEFLNKRVGDPDSRDNIVESESGYL